ncbi:tRNA (guanine-N(7)-)-methyltransferase (tRNA(m7G46)-methyltransferase), partial [Cryomyces antarcticus]
MKDVYDAERIVRGKSLSRNITESEELDLAIAEKYKNGVLHPATSLTYSSSRPVQQQHLRVIVQKLLPKLLPDDMLTSPSVSILIQEIVACAVLFPVMQMFADPDTWNQVMESYGRTMLHNRKTVRKLRAALDEHSPRPPKPSRSQPYPRLAPNDSERTFERYIRVIRQCNTLSDARRFRMQPSAKLSGVPPTPENASLKDILHNPSGLSCFMEYMDRVGLMRLVQLWVVVDGFRNPLEEDTDDLEEGSQIHPTWTESDRNDLAQISEAYLSRPELKVPSESREQVRSFLKSGNNATAIQYNAARRAVLKAQTSVFVELRDRHFPFFRKSDLYYKWLAME